MKILRNILIGLGSVFTLIIIFFVFMTLKSATFKDDYSPFVTKFMREFSEHWEISDVQYMLAHDFMEQIGTPDAQQTIARFRRFGKMKNLHDIELRNFRTITGTDSYKLGVFVFKADFENASGIVKLTVIVNAEGERVQSIFINPTTELNIAI